MSPQSHPECSLYSILECNKCDNLYRLADAIHYEGLSGAISQFWTNLWSPYETGQQLDCIYCHRAMPLQFCEDGSFIVPDRCPHCTSILPGRQEAKPVEQKTKPKPVPAFYGQKPKSVTESMPPIVSPPVAGPTMDMSELSTPAKPVAKKIMIQMFNKFSSQERIELLSKFGTSSEIKDFILTHADDAEFTPQELEEFEKRGWI